MLVFDHIGIVVQDVDAAVARFAAAIGATEATIRYDDPVLTVSVRFLRDRSGMTYEMIAPLGEGSVVSATLRKRQSILNQVAYRTGDLEGAGLHLKAQGYFALGEPKPAIAFNRARVQFFLSPMDFVLELIEAPDHQHAFHAIDPGIVVSQR